MTDNETRYRRLFQQGNGLGSLNGQETTAWLRRHAVFRTLPPHAGKELESVISRVGYRKGQTIYTETTAPSQLWILKEGRARLCRYSSGGRTFAFHVVSPGDVFCVPGIMTQCPYPCRAVADTDVVLLKIPAKTFQQFLARHPAFSYEVLKLVSGECCRAHALCSATQERVEQRLLAVLVRLMETIGQTIPLSRQQLAELAGVSRETANRILLKLQQRGDITLAFRRLTIQEPQRLRMWLSQSS